MNIGCSLLERQAFPVHLRHAVRSGWLMFSMPIHDSQIPVSGLENQYLRVFFTKLVERKIDSREPREIEASVLVCDRFHDFELSQLATTGIEPRCDQLPVCRHDRALDRLAGVGVDDPGLDRVRRVVRRAAGSDGEGSDDRGRPRTRDEPSGKGFTSTPGATRRRRCGRSR